MSTPIIKYGKVLSVDVLKQQLKIKMFEDEKFVTVGLSEIKSFKGKKRQNDNIDKELSGIE